MNGKDLTISGPYIQENLSIYLLHGADRLDGARFIPLHEALQEGLVTVHETGSVGQLEVENASTALDLFIQAGDIVKGGRQDRTIGVDFVVPAQSGRIPVPAFCVEGGRWHRRAAEDATKFSSSSHFLSSKAARLAVKLHQNQGEVWDKVAESQTKLSSSLGKSVLASASPSSYQLSMENGDLQKAKQPYRAALRDLLEKQKDAVGYAFAINGRADGADIYGSSLLFRKLWDKLLDFAIVEAIAARSAGTAPNLPLPDDIEKWFNAAEAGPIECRREVPPRIRVDTRSNADSVVFETHDLGLDCAVLHENIIVK